MSNQNSSQTLNFVHNYWKGAVSGMFGIVLSHPIDTIKTHYQNKTKPPCFINNIN